MASTQRFDPLLPQLTAPLLQEMAKSWGIGKGQFPKAKCVNAIVAGLKNPDQVRSLVAELKPYERLALELAKVQGGRVSTTTLLLTLRLLKLELPDLTVGYGDESIAFAQTLVRRGIFLPELEESPHFLYYGVSFDVLTSDDRLLAQVEAPVLPTLSLKSTSAPARSTYRRPGSVVLMILGLMQAIADLGGIKLTKAGAPQVSSLKKLTKAQNWGEDGVLLDGFWFPMVTTGFVAAFLYTGLLVPTDDESMFVLAEPIEAFADRPTLLQIVQVLMGFSVAQEWQEWSGGWTNPAGLVEARQILLMVLKLLSSSQDWHSLDDFDQFLFDRIGEHFSLTGYISRPFQPKASAEEAKAAVTRWRAGRRQDWQQREKPWLRSAFATWLYALGLVELGIGEAVEPAPTKTRSQKSPPSQADAIVSFRLTDLGRSAINPQSVRSLEVAAPKPAWIVQPNFEILVYLDDATAPQMVFLDRVADRVDIQQHTAHYRLTRESVYRGLERGLSLEKFLEELKAGAKVPLPQNVEIDVQQWGSLREQITLYRSTQLLEFPNLNSREIAIQQGLKGRPIADRFVLVTDNISLKSWVKQRVNYEESLRSCLTVTEIGEVTQTEKPLDLLLETQLQRWMEPRSTNAWALTQASVSQAVKAGSKVTDLLLVLQERLTHPLPLLLQIAITAWGGKTLPVEVEEITVLRCTTEDVFEAIATSDRLRSHFIGQLGRDILLVNNSNLKALKKDLDWLGLSLSAELISVPKLKKSATL